MGGYKAKQQREKQMFTPNKIFEGVPGEAKTFELINTGMNVGDWFEIREDEFLYFLGALPPLDHVGGNFSLSEFTSGTMAKAFRERRDRFYCVMINRTCLADFEDAMATMEVMLNMGMAPQ